MKEIFVIAAEPRSLQGKGASRRLRREGKVPAIIYGGQTEPEVVAVNHNQLRKQLKTEAFYSRILTVEIDGQSQQAVLKDLQRHPVRSDDILHLDLQRVRTDQTLRMHVPLHFMGSEIAPGVKTGGGVIEHHIIQVEVECLPSNLPEYIEIDLSAFEIGDSVYLSQLNLPENVALVELMHGKDALVTAIHLPRVVVEAEEATPAAEAVAPTEESKSEGKQADEKKDGK